MPSTRHRGSCQVQLGLPRSRPGSLHLFRQRCNSVQGMLQTSVHIAQGRRGELAVQVGNGVVGRLWFRFYTRYVLSSLPPLAEL